MTNQLPAYLQNRASKGLAQSLVANLGVGSPPFLSIMGNRLTLIDAVGEEIAVTTYDPKTGPYLDCVIIDALEHTSKIYYDKPYDPNASQYEPPACFSDNGVAPSRNASKPQSRTCAECQWGMWGSKTSVISGKGVKACNDVQKIALMVPGYEMPFLLRVPPNSRTNFRGYVNKFIGQPMDVEDVMTRIAFEQGSIGTLTFAAVGWLDEATVLPQRNKLIVARATDAMVGRTDLPRQEALPAPAQTQPSYETPNPTAQGQPTSAIPFAPAPAAAFQSMPAAPQQTQTAPPAPTASPSEPAPQQRRKRRTQAEMQAAQQPAAAPAQPQAAPFMPQPAPAPAFGMQAGAAPNAELTNVLDGLFGKK